MLLWFGAAQATPYPRSMQRSRRRRSGGGEVSSTAPPAAGAGESRSTAAAACLDTDNNNLELERHRINRPQEPYIRFNCVVAPRVQTHLVPGRLVARRLHLIMIIFKIRRHSE